MYELEDIVAFLFSRFDWVIPARKIEYLLFLIQYEKDNNEVIEYYYQGKPITRLEFKTPMDRKLINYLVSNDFEIDTSTIPNRIIMINRYIPFLPIEVINRIDYIIDKYYNIDIDNLEHDVNEILNIDKRKVIDLSSCKTFL